MFQFIEHIVDDLHPIFNHFPIALLSVSFLLAFAKRKWASLSQTEWLLFAWGALMTMPTAITGIVAHEAYEALPIHNTIESHGLPANLGTLFMLGLLIWRWRSRRKDVAQDVGNQSWYLAIAVLGLLWIFYVGGSGGSLTYDHGINVRGVNPLK